LPDEMLCDLSSVRVERGLVPVKAERGAPHEAPVGAAPPGGGALPHAALFAPWWEEEWWEAENAEQRVAAPVPEAAAGPARTTESRPWWEPPRAGRPAGAPRALQAAGAAAAPAQVPLGGAGLAAGAAGGSLGLAGSPPPPARRAIPSLLDIALSGDDWRTLAAAAPGRPAPWETTTAVAPQVHVTAFSLHDLSSQESAASCRMRCEHARAGCTACMSTVAGLRSTCTRP